MKHACFNLEDSLGHMVGRTTRALWNRLHSMFIKAGYDVTVEQWIVLVNLWHRDGQFQQQLADISGKDKTSITRLIDGLEKRNIVVRVPDAVDRRHKRIYLTNKGKKLQNELIPLAQKNLYQAQQNVKAEHMKICKDVLQKVYCNITET